MESRTNIRKPSLLFWREEYSDHKDYPIKENLRFPVTAMKKIFFFTALIIISTTNLFAQTRSIEVQDKRTKTPVMGAHVKDHHGSVITITDENGLFRINPDEYAEITISALGFSDKKVSLDDIDHFIFLDPVIFRHTSELIVIGSKDQENNIHSYQNRHEAHSMDEFLDNIDGITATKRGAFGWEPVVRGQSDQRMNLMIDGMQVFKACVDKMDPITSYVETNNLEKLSIDKSGSGIAQNGNGNSTVNLITQKAKSTPFSMNLSSSYRAPDNYRTLSATANGSDSSGKHAFRLSGTYKKADDFVAGGDRDIANTQFEKMNLNLSYKHTFSSGHSVEANYITDKAYDVGYPALLMDATKALADIGQIQFQFAPNQKSVHVETVQLYANAIRHTMDDYDRDVANRSVMRGMYMPMYGTTKTFGTRVNGHAMLKNHNVNWFFNAFYSEAYGDMLMEPLDPEIEDMMIYNMDEVITRSVSLGLRHRLDLSESVMLKFEENIRINSLGTNSETHASFFEGLYDRELSTQTKPLVSASGSVLWMLNDRWSFSGNLVYSQRMGNHIELFGHYIYNYTDGYFYDGNPWLKTEHSLNTDLNTTWEINDQSISLSLFHKRYYHYIDGVMSDADNISNFDFQFKRYDNVGDAMILGGELRSINNVGQFLRLENRISYLFAQNLTLDEPLPLIPPLKGISTLSITKSQNTLTAELEWSAEQNRIAELTSSEDKTDAYAIANIAFERSWMKNTLNTSIQVSNLMDNYYHTHTSIGNIPEAGRRVMITVSYGF